MIQISPVVFAEPALQIEALCDYIDRAEAVAIGANLGIRFAHYNLVAPAAALTPTPACFNARMEMIRGLYDKQCARIRELKRCVRERNIELCPYCGKVEAPIEIDHIAPKSEWAEYSIYTGNLVAVCSECNLTKRDNYRDPATAARLFLNPYVDSFMSGEFVHVVISADPLYGFDVPDFEFVPSVMLPPADYNRVSTHFKRLEVASRYARFGVNRLKLLKLSWSGKARADLLGDLVRQNTNEGKVYGDNCWACLLYRSILGNNNLIDYILR